ncbi:hypothetical protein AMATHDRAFT_62998 [Amanita thiersii Skay4041]|uniref:DUF4243 domain-containing protein n=1 Tax=Amanita thiersii Skay4041 TaxID=703135 RepID=A0A2A9NEV7_9AGAR|nr:hypothetical protein AMATHDRAFT_62998 [Amanita thiersii Skay4041]
MTVDLFPIPRSSPIGQDPNVPTALPGPTPKTSQVLITILKDIHERWHCYFNRETGFHNHTSHHAIALWSLGANGVALQQAYARDSAYQLPMVKPPGEITENNWKKHLGDDSYYKAYVDFFSRVVQERGPVAAVEDYVFSLDANFSQDGSAPHMLCRFMAMLFHSMIFVGYGLEYEIPGMVVEGLAQGAIHMDDSSALLSPAFFKQCFNDVGNVSLNPLSTQPIVDPDAGRGASTKGIAQEKLASLVAHFSGMKQSTPRQSGNVHALSIISRMLKDSKFEGIREMDVFEILPTIMKKYSGAIRNYADQWSIGMRIGDPEHNEKELKAKLEELAWAYTALYGLGGWTKGQHFNADFFLAHIVTSASFLPSIAKKLEVPSQVLLLRSHFAVALAWWVGRGRPGFDIAGLSATMNEVSDMPSNPWLPIIQSAIAHEEDHVPKLQRTFVYWSQLYGHKGPNDAVLSSTELPDADKIDGTLFIKVAKMTSDRVSSKAPLPGHENEPAVFYVWDRSGFYSSA